MTKKEFLEQLRCSLSILEEKEQEDIVSEYEQHIDMKMKSGLTEEAAIEDFGSIQELTAEILEAYHVRGDYVAKTHNSMEVEKQIWKKVKGSCHKVKENAMNGIKNFWHACVKVCNVCGEQLKRPWVWMVTCIKKNKQEKREAKDITVEVQKYSLDTMESAECGDIVEGTEEILKADNAKAYCKMDTGNQTVEENSKNVQFSQKNKEQQMMKKKTVGAALQNIIRQVFHGIGRIICYGLNFCWWCMRLGWNIGWICFGAFAGFCGAISLFLTGACIVILTQGYPLVGITIGCLGLTCSFSAVTGLSFSFLCHLRKENKTSQKKGAIVCAE